MKKPSALRAVFSLLFLFSGYASAGHAARNRVFFNPPGAGHIQAPPQAAYSARWQSREEYDAYNAMAQHGKNLEAQIALAEAFLRKFPTSDFRSGAYLTEMQCYYRLNRTGPAIEAARTALRFDHDNLVALTFLSYVFPFSFQPDRPAAGSMLTGADYDARRGLEALQRFRRPANVTPEQFPTYVKPKRAIFENTLGFVALQRKDYADAITALRAAGADNPSDVFAFYLLGLAYLFSTPADYDHGIWDMARAASLARASKSPSGPAIFGYLRKVFVQTTGSDAGLEDTITQASADVNPPEGLERPRAPRGEVGPGPNGSASAFHQPNPTAPPAAGQTGNLTLTRVYAPIYPTWLPPSDNESVDQAPPPPPAEPGDPIAAQFYNLGGAMSVVGQEQPWQYTRPPVPPEPPEPEPAPPATVLVYKDGRQVEVQDYAIVGEILVWFSGQLSKKIPLADLDLLATRKVNEDHGIAFGAADAP